MRVPRVYILALSSFLWAVPAFLLLRRSLMWMSASGNAVVYVLVPFLVAGIVIGYAAWFRKIVLQNVQRIRSLPPRVAVWHISTPRGYVVVLLMVTLGALLRSSEIPRLFLAAPYALMGGFLFLGSVHTALACTSDIFLSGQS